MSIRSVITLVIKPGANEQFEAAFAAAGMLTRPKAIDADFTGKLLRATDDPETYFVVATWSSPEAYAQWQRSSRDGADAGAIKVLDDVLVRAVPGKACDVVLTS